MDLNRDRFTLGGGVGVWNVQHPPVFLCLSVNVEVSSRYKNMKKLLYLSSYLLYLKAKH